MELDRITGERASQIRYFNPIFQISNLKSDISNLKLPPASVRGFTTIPIVSVDEIHNFEQILNSPANYSAEIVVGCTESDRWFYVHASDSV